MNNIINVGLKIKERRVQLGMSAEQLAEILGVSPATIYRYENNDIKHFKIDKLEPIAKALLTTPEHFMGWDKNNAATPENDGASELTNVWNELSEEGKAKLLEHAQLLKEHEQKK